MKFNSLLTDGAVMVELGRRLAEARIAHQLTQAGLAEAAGLSKRTVERLERGEAAHLNNLVRYLRAIDKIDGLDRLLPETPANPIDLLKRRTPARVRTKTRGRSDASADWTWGDDT